MKTRIISIASAILLLATTFTACKKENQPNPKLDLTTINQPLIPNISVNNYGILEFNNESSVDLYVTYLLNNSIANVLSYHTSIQFNSLAKNTFNNQAQTTITEEQIKYFLLNEDGLIKIGNNIFKISNDDLYLYTVSSQNFNNSIWAKLKNGQFDNSKMNRFATNIIRSESFDLLKAISIKPTGVNETNPPQTIAEKKFWGTRIVRMPCNEATGERWVNKVRDYFWIKTVWEDGWFEPC